MLKFGNNLKLEIIDYIFRKIIMLNEVNILESPNKYHRKKSRKIAKKTLCPTLYLQLQMFILTPQSP